MKYKYFLFDWDGSLANTIANWFETHKEILRRRGIVVSDEVVREETFGKLDWRELGITDRQGFEDEVEQLILPSLDRAVLNPNVKEILSLIKQEGGKIAITTDSKRRWLEKAVPANGLDKIVDLIVTREDVSKRKPDAEEVLTVMKFFGADPGETLVTGDNWRDVIMARSAGVDSCLYYPEWYHKFYVEESQIALKPTYMIRDFVEMKRWI